MSGSGHYTCVRCGILIYGDKYKCSFFETYAHKECGPLKLFFHPCLLSLITRYDYGYTCNCCYGRISGSGCRCEKCDFDMCSRCVNKVLSVHHSECEDGHIKHFSHRHPLKLFQKMEDLQTCQLCGKLCSTSTYGCSRCNFYLHEFCKEILCQEIQHSFHPCPLILLTTPSFTCDDCVKRCSGLTFRCGTCYVELCMECCLLPTIESSDGQKTIQRLLHKHPLSLNDKEVAGETFCRACGKPCTCPFYACDRCNFFLHESCTESPPDIIHFSHASHPLTFHYENYQNFKCKLCLKNTNHGFRCNDCDFHLCSECAFLTPSINYMAHKHLLSVVEKIYDKKLECRACCKSCGGSPAFRCLECDFSLHLECGPLPAKIKHESHIDWLSLKDFHIEDDNNKDDDEDEFYCDACEQPRNPRICVYGCIKDCPFNSHIECVISEVIASLRGERGDVELRTVGRQIVSKVLISKELAAKQVEETATQKTVENISLNELLFSLDAAETKKFTNAAIRLSELQYEDVHEDAYELPYSENTFAGFLNMFDSTFWSKPPEFISRHNEFVLVRNYWLPLTLLPTFEDLIAKRGDVSANSKWSPKVKSLVFYTLCSVICDMETTVVADITKDKFCQWLTCLKLVNEFDFEIQFIWHHVEGLASAHFGLQLRRFLRGAPVEQDEEIRKINEEIQELKEKVEEANARLAKVREQKESYKAYVKTAPTSKFLTKCFDDAREMRWKLAATGLL